MGEVEEHCTEALAGMAAEFLLTVPVGVVVPGGLDVNHHAP